MASVQSLIEQLMEFPAASVAEAGEKLLRFLSDGSLNTEEFLADPLVLVRPPFFTSRYVVQVTRRALNGDYETVEEIVASLNGLIDRNPPVIEPRRQAAVDRVVLPEAKVLGLSPPKNIAGVWESSITALVTSGPLRDSEVEIRLRSDQNAAACMIVDYLWDHCSFAAYNLVRAGERELASCPETFLVVEPARQINATSVSRSLHCTKPQFDQIRRGRGDVTVPTLKGQLVHSLFDRMLEGETDVDAAYRELLPGFLVPLASVTDGLFDENAFRADALRHAASLTAFIEANPHLLQHAQLELRRYSATIGIQGRIDALFRQGNRLDILELKTGARIRDEDHAQLFIYKLLLSDLIRRWQRDEGAELEITSRLLSSVDGTFAPLRVASDFYKVLDTRNKLVALQHSLAQKESHAPSRHEGFDARVCGSCVSWTKKRCKEASDVFGDRPGAPETPELEYFRRFTRLVQQERWQADQDVADLLDDSRIEQRIRNFRAIAGLRIVSNAEPFTFEFDANTSDLERGDSVVIHTGRISSSSTYHGYVKSVGPRRVRVSIPLKHLDAKAFEGQSWIIDRFPSDVTAEASHTALYDFLVAPMDAKKRAILSSAGAVCDRPRTGGHRPPLQLLNASQMEAIERAVGCEVFHLIWGPPGTGKTRVIPEIVSRLSRIGGGVLLGAFTNTAVDKMLLAVLEHDPATRFLRIGRASDSPELATKIVGDPADYFSEDLAAKYGNVTAVREALKNATVVAATAHRASTLPFLRTRSFEMAIVDEAAQLTEPLTLGLILRARRFVLIGDDKQLPPVVRARALAHSMFERLKLDKDAESLTLLDTQYRMHPEIMEVSNRLFYAGKLRSGVGAGERKPFDGVPLVFVPVHSEVSREGRANREEARVVNELVRSFLTEGGVDGHSIGVVSPFRAQVVLLRQMLDDTGVAVDTIERFQGGERDIMVISLVRSQGTGFVFDDRRLNVAITRARRKLVLVAHPELFQSSRYEWICTYTETLKIAGTT